MTTWQHAGTGEWCDHDVSPRGPEHEPEACGCTAPLPDPASPCGFFNDYMRWRAYDPCGLPDGGLSHAHGDIFGPHRESAGCHSHVPTLCSTCHHPIVEATDA